MRVKPGTILHFIPNQQEERGFRLSVHQPCLALVTFKHDDGTVNAIVYSHDAIPVQMFKLPIWDGKDEKPKAMDRYLVWPDEDPDAELLIEEK